MKMKQKITTLLLAFVLMMSTMSLNVLAHTSLAIFDGTTKGSLTINKTDGAGTAIKDPDLEYSIYKIATVSQPVTATNVTLQYTYESGVDLAGGGSASGIVPSGVTAATYDVTNMTATAVVNNAGGTGTLTFGNLDLGLYLVVETKTPAGVSVANNFLVSIPLSETTSGGVQQWNYDPVAEPKNTVVDNEISKTVTGGADAITGGNNTFTTALGAELTYEIKTKLPSTFTVTPYTTYTVTDIPDAALTIDKDGSGAAGSFDGIVVSVGGTPLMNGIDYTIANSGNGFVIELITAQPTATPPSTDAVTPGVQSSYLTNGATVTITYKATLLATATGHDFTNDAKVESEYNTPGGTVTPPPIEPPEPPTVYVYDYALQKIDDSATPVLLADAEFVIMNASGQYMTYNTTDGWGTTANLNDTGVYKVKTATGITNAIVSFKGLAAGNYKIIETAAPTGYSLLKDPISVTVDQTSTADADTLKGGIGYSIQVVNALANTFTLPGTGGMGIYLYTIGGILLIAAAVILLTKHRNRNKV